MPPRRRLMEYAALAAPGLALGSAAMAQASSSMEEGWVVVCLSI